MKSLVSAFVLLGMNLSFAQADGLIVLQPGGSANFASGDFVQVSCQSNGRNNGGGNGLTRGCSCDTGGGYIWAKLRFYNSSGIQVGPESILGRYSDFNPCTQMINQTSKCD